MRGRATIRISPVQRRTPFISLLHRTPPRTVCPNFYVLAHANGCSFAPGCEYCYLTSSLWYLHAPRLFANVDRLLAETREWIRRDDLPATVLNTGNLSDSLCFEEDRPLLGRLIELFREEAEARGRPHALLVVTKGGRRETVPLASAPPCRNVIVSFSVNDPEAARCHEQGVPEVAERLAAARELAAAGWRIRMRIDPMIRGYGYAELARQVATVPPERVTLGCLRAEPGLLRKSPSGLFRDLVPDGRQQGSLARYPLAERLGLYRQALEGLAAARSTAGAAGRIRGTDLGLCEETPEVWSLLGLDPAAKSCNCGP